MACPCVYFEFEAHSIYAGHSPTGNEHLESDSKNLGSPNHNHNWWVNHHHSSLDHLGDVGSSSIHPCVVGIMLQEASRNSVDDA